MRTSIRTGSRLALAAAVMLSIVAAVAVIAGHPGVMQHLQQLHPLAQFTITAPLTFAGPMILAKAKSFQELEQQASAQVAGQPEAVPWCFYDTQTYVDNTSVSLDFFANVNADKTLSNMSAQAAIPAPNYFEVVAFTCDFLSRPTNANAAVTGALDDIAALLNTGRARFIFSLNQKPYADVPLRAVGSSGGAVGLVQGTTAANQVEEFGTSSIPGANPLRIEKAVTISPNNNFGVTLQFAAAVDLTANLNICIGMWGVYHRKVT